MTNGKASHWLWYNSVLLSNGNDQAINTVTNIEEFQVNYVKRKKPDSKGWKCNGSIYNTFRGEKRKEKFAKVMNGGEI